MTVRIRKQSGVKENVPAPGIRRGGKWMAALRALARYRRFVAQPWRMSGDRVGLGNRRQFSQ